MSKRLTDLGSVCFTVRIAGRRSELQIPRCKEYRQVGRYDTIRLRRWAWNICVCGLLWCLAEGSIAAEPESPTQLVQHLIKAISSIKEGSNGNLSAADQANNATAAKTANTLLDIPAVSQWTLGKHWEARSPAEQREFIVLLEQLF